MSQFLLNNILFLTVKNTALLITQQGEKSLILGKKTKKETNSNAYWLKITKKEKVQKCATCIKYSPGILTGRFHTGLPEKHMCSQFLRMQTELFCENSQLTCLWLSFSQWQPKMSLPAELPVAGNLSGEAFKVVNNFSRVSIDHMNRKALTAHMTAKHSRIYCLITSKCL